ncbi:MAG: hypothetical protein Q9164_004875, partial [Protoblastenia rupestris]
SSTPQSYQVLFSKQFRASHVMSTVAYFVPPFKSNVLSNDHSSFLSVSPIKRKRESEDEIGEPRRQQNAEIVIEPRDPSQTFAAVAEKLKWTRDDHVAGDALETNEHSGPKVLPYRRSVASIFKASPQIARELGSLRPPLRNRFHLSHEVSPTKPSHSKGLKKQHLDALVAVIHRSILDGDFQRARRAWGNLLRLEVNGQSLDLRTGGRWGLGAEFDLQSCSLQTYRSDGDSGATKNDTPLPQIFSNPEDLEKAKDYLGRLILQYPYRKAFPDVTGPLDFHLALFGFWISSIIHEGWLATPDLPYTATNEEQNSADAFGENETMEERPTLRVRARRHSIHESTRKNTLRRIYGLNAQLDKLLSSPPYSDEPSFWELKGMVALWTADLSLESDLSPSDEVIHKDYHHLTPHDFDHLQHIATCSHSQSVGSDGSAQRAGALLQAREAFERVTSCDRSFNETLLS